MKMISWNVNSIKARKEIVLDWLESHKPDVAFLQELKTDGEHYPFDEIEALGYVSEVNGQKGYAGVATLVKKGIEYTLISKALLEEPEEQARFVEVEIDGIRMINIYAPNGNPQPSEKYDYKLRWYQKLEDKLSTYMRNETPFLIGGDFNIIPENKDCYDPNAWQGDALFTKEIRDIYRRMINSGMVDAFRVFDSNALNYTFWDYQAGAWQRNNGIRIDHFLLSPYVTDRLKGCVIDKEPRALDKPSDHVPVILEIN
ncbi:MAG: exodeoxyribonuclease III [Micavibrio sp.]|nr:exodeoxyribonuclease III [Micavibrio sp.]|tara:strand:- start:4043 stop:4813 length:771 start_codon:yes stop_codon:yes gene_type:complete